MQHCPSLMGMRILCLIHSGCFNLVCWKTSKQWMIANWRLQVDRKNNSMFPMEFLHKSFIPLGSFYVENRKFLLFN